MAASTKCADFYCRGSGGVWRVKGTVPPYEKDESFASERSKNCRCLCFSQNGDKLAWHDGTNLKIYDVAKDRLLHTIESKASLIDFSPQSSYLSTWQTYTVKDNKPQYNLFMYNVETGEVAAQFYQKKTHQWEPQWSADEKVCARNYNNELQFYEEYKFSEAKTKLQVQKVSTYSLAKNKPPYTVAAYAPGTKGMPGNVRVYRYPEFSGHHSALASKSFFKADRVTLEWNSKGTALLILTAVDTSETSYYGEQGLHFLAINGDSCVVPLGKNGPVYLCTWHPSGQEFTVVYGYMPAKCTIYNLKNEPVFDFGTGPRNQAFYNPFGNILCLAGFGNLQGNLEFWDLGQKKLISTVSARDATHFQWAPDGSHVLTATLAPRMRVGNGYKIWHYTGSLMKSVTIDADAELWQAIWCPAPEGHFTIPTISYKAVETTEKAPTLPSSMPAYRPPGARGKPATTQIHVYELPSNQKPAPGTDPATDSAPLSKNQKRKKAKAAAQAAAAAQSGEEGGQDLAPPSSKPTPAPQVAPQKSTQSSSSSRQSAVNLEAADGFIVPLTGDVEKDKKIRTLSKKLQQILKLREDQAAGVKLQNNQLEKLKKLDDIKKELEDVAK